MTSKNISGILELVDTPGTDDPDKDLPDSKIYKMISEHLMNPSST